VRVAILEALVSGQAKVVYEACARRFWEHSERFLDSLEPD
jgi:hypothetical protein